MDRFRNITIRFAKTRHYLVVISMEMLLRQIDGENYKEKCFYSLLKIYNFRNIVHFLKRMLQVVDNAVFWQNVLYLIPFV